MYPTDYFRYPSEHCHVFKGVVHILSIPGSQVRTFELSNKGLNTLDGVFPDIRVSIFCAPIRIFNYLIVCFHAFDRILPCIRLSVFIYPIE